MNSVLALPSGRPLQTVYSWQANLAREIAERVSLKEFDIVHVEHLRGSRYGTFLKGRFPELPVVWDSVDCISHLFQQAVQQSRSFFGKFVTRFELPRTEKEEGNLICTFDHVLVTSSADRKALFELPNGGKRPSQISVLPNGVDLNYFYPNAEFQREPDTLLFSGKMSYHANISMVRYLVTEIMPRIWEERPTAKLWIVGKDPSADIRDLSKNPLVTVTGTVSDIRPFLWRATVSVVPLLYGAGIQNKILEAMATSTPVITTARALAALSVQPGNELLVANSPDDFSQAVLSLMADRGLQGNLGQAGEAYVRTHHSWTGIASRLVDLYQETLSSHGAAFQVGK
jgi:glycosyltransferase involved in cell wall biosynthesis